MSYEALSGCHLWTGSVNKFGYGKLSVGPQKWKLAHRISYELNKGKILEDKSVLHQCDVPSCVNPDHLYLGDYKQNALDREKEIEEITFLARIMAETNFLLNLCIKFVSNTKQANFPLDS